MQIVQVVFMVKQKQVLQCILYGCQFQHTGIQFRQQKVTRRVSTRPKEQCNQHAGNIAFPNSRDRHILFR